MSMCWSCCSRTSRAIRCLALLAICLALPARAALAQATCNSATVISVGTPFVGTNASSPGDGLAGLCAQTSRSVWHFFTPAVSGNHTISLCGSNIDSVATLYTACGGIIMGCDDNTCGNASVLVVSLTAGSTYFLRVASQGATPGGQYTVLVTAPGLTPPANDNCGAGVTLSSNTPVRASNLGSVGSDQTACGIADNSDVWFSFVAPTAGTHRVEVCATGFAPVVSQHVTCIGGQSAICSTAGSPSNCTATGVTLDFSPSAGQLVLLRVAGQRGSFGSFDIVVYTPRPNDLCSAAIPLTVNTPIQGSTTPIVAVETTVPCAPSLRDVWHSFVPSATGVYTVSTCGSAFDTVLSVHSACPDQPGSSVLACNDDFCSRQSQFNVTLMAGQPYVVRVAGKNTANAWGNYTLLVSQQATANNDCASAFPLPLSTPTPGTSIAATGNDITSCGLLDTKDVWFTFTPPATGSYEFHTCGSNMDTTLALFTSCASTIAFACNDNDAAFCGVGTSTSRLIAALNIGQTYLVRVAGVSGTEGNFTLTAARTPPPNTTCAQAAPLPASTLVAGTLTGDTSSSGLAACGAGDGPDAWFTFTPPVSRFWRFETCGSVLPAVLTLYTNCPPSMPISCNAAAPGQCPVGAGAALTSFLQAGVTYRLRVGQNTAIASGTAFQIIAHPVAPPNDECAGAQRLELNTPTLGAVLGSAPSTPLLCAPNDTRDVWFVFTPPRSGTYQFNTCAAGATFDTAVSIHVACSKSTLACNNDAPSCGTLGSRVSARLTAGQDYLIRVAGANASEGMFTLTAAIAVPANDACAQAQGVTEGVFPYDTLAATTDPAFIDLSCTAGFNLINNDVWFRYVPIRTGPVTAGVCGSTFDTAIAVSLAGSGCPSGLYSVLTCNDDFPCVPGSGSLSLQSSVTWNAVAGVPYFIRVGSRTGATGSGDLRVDAVPACRCDWDRNDVLSTQDVFAFLNSWFAGTGDFNNDTLTTLQDVFDFLNCYFARPAGCGTI